MRATLYSIVLFTLAALPLRAQETDSVFPGYAAYAHFVDQHISTRDFTEVILRLGGRDEYTKEEIASLQRQFDGIWSVNFQNGTVFNRQDLGGGVSQEARMYWTGKSYCYFYALLHQRENDLVVINFALNSNSTPIMDRF
ncbi:hypothetical protein [Sulfitobacter mediterraneus]|uniref:DUF4019 domain-containing protein n=1 Tax=Sulfitobacter mediterraneus TaxID=83219 RepID=A0A061SQE4_9RHOB|nr:hypothetical protein [Sulfitobacter mediterraneus]KAJ01634.1 hypothetical protein PM02_18355 [Sulfitobacter mediterraneus]